MVGRGACSHARLHPTLMDEADIANDRAEVDLQRALQVRRPEGPLATGACLWCSEPVPQGFRWCNRECRDYWQRFDAES